MNEPIDYEDEARRAKCEAIALYLVKHHPLAPFCEQTEDHPSLSAMLETVIDDDDVWRVIAKQAKAHLPSVRSRSWIISYVKVAEAAVR